MIYVLSSQAFYIKPFFVSRIAKIFPHYTHVHILNLYYFKCTIRSKVLMKYMYLFTTMCYVQMHVNFLNVFEYNLPCLGYYLIKQSIDKDNDGYRLPFTLNLHKVSCSISPLQTINSNAAPTQAKLVKLLFIKDFRKIIMHNFQPK